MDVFKTASEFILARKLFSGSLGFVPTMGALHKGHLSLIAHSKAENQKTACSIFVNPIQFNNREDFDKYPHRLDEDLHLLEAEGCDWVFVPSAQEMYPTEPKMKFDFGLLENVMEGKFRRGHFNGVAIVVSKLFHIVQPSVAYLGQKDLQQTLVIRQLVEDLGFPMRLKTCETLRESNGLAMSSRNLRLSPEARENASVLYAAMLELKNRILVGEGLKSASILPRNAIKSTKGMKLQYFEVVDANTLQPIGDDFIGDVAICIAAYFEGVRLIDNLVFQKIR